ncbi:phage integrase N-terminal SAM-like domain-containing protein [Hoeflea sp. G2-23]|uniref:Phage integrase N-terminal SAM-like domain-containing protein n=1 Tax=Hoeflea algicola TaxID=2983763 RepID=A0ABT3Z9Z3_9HYPH|nr:phage integrase N-terminal SAM-like domain-containing protein [Hoeflea algicola]MCY0148544.1 phage integrase N-terminal SAM-like domain-containing protein [Hoeflea algicola]
MHNQSNTTAISPFRQRLIDDMNLRHFGHETQRNYLRDVGRLASFLGRSPDTATADDLRRFQIWQQSEGVPVPTMNSIVSVELPPESGPPTGIDYPSNWRISDGWKTREAGRDCIEASAG